MYMFRYCSAKVKAAMLLTCTSDYRTLNEIRQTAGNSAQIKATLAIVWFFERRKWQEL